MTPHFCHALAMPHQLDFGETQFFSFRQILRRFVGQICEPECPVDRCMRNVVSHDPCPPCNEFRLGWEETAIGDSPEVRSSAYLRLDEVQGAIVSVTYEER